MDLKFSDLAEEWNLGSDVSKRDFKYYTNILVGFKVDDLAVIQMAIHEEIQEVCLV